MTVELKPCPFCGGEELEIFANCISCERCGASGPTQDGPEFSTNPALRNDDWNRRAALTNTSGDDEAPVATWKRQENGNNWLNIHDKALFQSSSNAEIPLFAQPQPATSGDDEEVGEQWCALENGHQTTSWKPVGFLGDKSGWDELAKRNPDRYQVVIRKVYARPQSAAVREGILPEKPGYEVLKAIAWMKVDPKSRRFEDTKGEKEVIGFERAEQIYAGIRAALRETQEG